MKKVWITALSQGSQEQIQNLSQMLAGFGLAVDGHFWADDNANMVWAGPKDVLTEADTRVWLILSTKEELEKPAVRLGLSLLALVVQEKRGHSFPIVLAHDGHAPSPDDLPTPLAGALILAAQDPAIGPKLVAKANVNPRPVPTDYRLKVYPMMQFGLWIEVGPTGGEPWAGALFGVAGGEIDSVGVGKAGSLPQKAVLEFPMKDMKVELGGKPYTAWAVRNVFDRDDSFFIRILGEPEAVVFGPLGDTDAPELFTLRLR